jgi:hypothetical protein
VPEKFLTYLMGMNVPNLKTIASRVGHFVPENSKQRLASGILQKLTRRDSLASVIEELGDHAHQLLRFIYHRPDKKWVYSDFASFEEVWSEPDVRSSISEIVNSGLLGSVFSPRIAAEVYFCFEETTPLVREVIGASEQVPFKAVSAPVTLHHASHAWRTDLVTLLGYLIRNTVQITKQNLPHRRDLKALSPVMMGTRFESLCKRMTGRDLDWIGRLQHWLRQAGIVRVEGSSLSPQGDPFSVFLEKFPADREHHPLAAGLGPEERMLEADARETLKLVRGMNPGDTSWYRVADLERAVYPVEEIFETGSPPVAVRFVLLGLLLTGQVDLGEDDSGWLWRRSGTEDTGETAPTGHLHVQPNFEIIASTTLPLADRCVLEQIAELTGIDHQLLHYKITRDSVYSGLCIGWSAEKQIEWYTEAMGGKRPLAQNVAHSISSWGASFGRLSLERPLLLVCDSRELAEQIYHSKEMGPFCLGMFNETSLIMREGTEEEVLEAILKTGLLPRPEVGDGTRWALELSE